MVIAHGNSTWYWVWEDVKSLNWWIRTEIQIQSNFSKFQCAWPNASENLHMFASHVRLPFAFATCHLLTVISLLTDDCAEIDCPI